eukprot:349751_1
MKHIDMNRINITNIRICIRMLMTCCTMFARSNETGMQINMKAMNDGLLSEYDPTGLGYIGYSFAKDLFCCNDYEGVEIAFLNMILPALTNVWVTHLSSIDSLFLDQLLDYLTVNTNDTYSKY